MAQVLLDPSEVVAWQPSPAFSLQTLAESCQHLSPQRYGGGSVMGDYLDTSLLAERWSVRYGHKVATATA